MPDSHLIKFDFDQEHIEIKLLTLNPQKNRSRYSQVKNITKDNASIDFSTPQFAAEREINVNVRLLKNFKGIQTLEDDIVNEGFKEVAQIKKPQKINYKKINVFTWVTPTMGSAIYYYLQSPHDSSTAIRIGPFASIVAKDFEFDWSNAKWIQLQKN